MADNIDITINETVENIDIVVNPNLIEVNITKIDGANVDNLVPYIGATDDVNLGSFDLTANNVNVDVVNFDLDPIVPTSVGSLYWDNVNKTLSLIDGVGATTLQIGQEERVLIKNTTGATLTDGKIVYITGATGNLPSVSLASALNETTSAATLGMVTETITNGSSGFVTIKGLVNGLNTLAFNEGDILWLSNTAGEYTNVKPTSPSHLVLIGYVTKKSAQGSVYVKIQNTQELNECSDVLFGTLSNNDLLIYESSTGLWKNKKLSTLLGGTVSQFVKGNGSLDSTIYATQSALNTEITNRTNADVSTLSSANSYTDTGLTTKQNILSGTGIVKSTGGTISYLTDNSSNWNTAFGWGNHTGLYAPITGGTGYIQNQNASAQSAYMWISGDIKSNSGVFFTPSNIARALVRAEVVSGDFRIFQYDSGGAYLRNALSISNSTGDATFASTVTASNVVTNDNINGYNIEANKTGGFGSSLALKNSSSSSNSLIRFFKPNNTDFYNLYTSSTGIELNGTIAASNGTLIGGTLASGYIPKATGANSLDDSQIIDNGTDVGIGATVSGTKLNISSDNKILSLQNITNGTTASPVSRKLVWASTAPDERASIDVPDARSNVNGVDMIFRSMDNAGVLAERMRIANGGNVLIGTTTDDGSASKLQVNGSVNITTNNFFRYNNNTGVIGSGTSISGGTSSQLGIKAGNEMLFATGGSTERMRITSTGNVGIGTTSPSAKLHIQDTNGGVFFDGSGATYNRFKSTTSSASVGRDLLFSTQNSGTTPDLYINSVGNVGIGTTTDSGNKLIVVGGSTELESLKIANTPTTSAGTPPLLTWNSFTKNVESVPYATFAPTESPTFTGDATFASTVTASNIVTNDNISGYNIEANKTGGYGSSLALKNSSTLSNSLIRFFKPNNIDFYNLYTSNTGIQLNGTITASNGTLLGGTLTSNYIPKATGANSLGNSQIIDNGTNVGIGTTTDNGYKLIVNGNLSLGLNASAPTGVEGAIYYNSTTKKHYGFDGTTWNALY